MNLIHLQRSRDSVSKKLLSLLLAFVLLFGFLPGTAWAQALEQTQSQLAGTAGLQAEELYEGLSFNQETVKNDTGGNVNTFVTTVDTNNDALKFLTGTPNDTYNLTPGLRQSTSGQAKAAYGNGRNVVAAINADYFNINDNTLIQPQGLTIKDGQLLVGPHDTRYFFGVKKDGTPVIGDKTLYDSIKDDLQQAVGGRYCILKDGVVTTHQDARAPRTSIGITADGKVIMAVADGRTDVSAGFYLSEMGAYLKSLGAVIAMELDGGGSSASVIRTPGTSNFVVKNSPSDGSERPVGDTLLVLYEDPNADEPSLEKDTDGYYLIKIAADFDEIQKDPGSNYRLANDIDFSGVSPAPGPAFSGILDGAGHTLLNLRVTSGQSVALFTDLLQKGKIHNLHIVGANLKSTSAENLAYTSLVGINYGTIENVHFSGRLAGNGYVAPFAGTQESTGIVKNSTSNVVVSATGPNVSGAVGWNKGGKIQDVTVTGKISGARYVGGISGDYTVGGQILRCSVGAVVNGSGTRVGGISGNISGTGTIESCYANVTVKSNDCVGGIVGYADGTGPTIKNNIVEGTVQAAKEPGGVGGLLKVRTTNNIVKNMTVTSTGTGTVSSGNVAGLLGAWCNGSNPYSGNVILSGSIITTPQGEAHRLGYHDQNKSNNYVSTSVTINGSPETGGAENNRIGADATEEQLTSQSFYQGLGFDFSAVFDWDETKKTPVLKNVDQTVKAPPETGIGPGEAELKALSLNVGRDQTERNFVWYSDSDDPGFLQYVPASAVVNGVFPAEYTNVPAQRTTGAGDYFACSATATGLAPGTRYAYRVGNEDGWSPIYTFATEGSENFSFLLAGDPQIGSSGNADSDTAGWNRTLQKAASWFPDVNFLISAGDQVENSTYEGQYDGFLAPEYLRSHTLATNIGNHDSGSDIYKKHFNLPNTTALEGDTAAGGDYWYSYNGVLFLSLNSNNISTAQHKAFLEGAIQAYKDRNGGKDPVWKIVTFHHSVYSVASHTDDGDILQRRNELPPMLSEMGIDAVLMGHDHSYTRSFMMNGTTPITAGYTADGSNQYAGYTDDPAKNEVFYLTANSASGSKFYAIKNLEFPFMAVDNQENTPNLTKIDVTEGALTFTTYRTGASNTVNDVVDKFTLSRAQISVAPAITTADLPAGTAGKAYNQTLAAEGTAPITWSVESGKLPDGLTLAEDGTLSGTPAADGTFTFTVKATNSAGSATKELSIQVAAAPKTDLDHLNDLIAACEALKESRFEAESWANLQAKLAAAKEVVGNPEATSEAIGEAFDQLFTARNDLVYSVDKDILQLSIEIAQNTDTTGCTSGSIRALNAALEAAQNVLNRADATQEEVNDAAKALLNAVINLKDIMADKAELQKLADLAAGLTEAKYTPASWSTVKGALEAAQILLPDDDATQEAVDGAYGTLAQAVAHLTLRAQTNSLNVAIELAQTIVSGLDQYAPATVEGLQEKLDAAKAVQGNLNATQEEVDAAAKALAEAAAQARLKANKKDLQQAYVQAQKLDPEKYTEASIQQMNRVLAATETVLKDENAMQAEVDQAKDALTDAVQTLEVKPTSGTGNSSSPDSNSSSSSSSSGNGSSSSEDTAGTVSTVPTGTSTEDGMDSPQTGEPFPTAVPIVSTAAFIGMALILIYRKKLARHP